MTIPIALESHENVSYDITIDSLSKLCFNKKVAIVTNPTIADYHLKTLLSKDDCFRTTSDHGTGWRRIQNTPNC